MRSTATAVFGMLAAAACLAATACGSSDPLAGMTGKQVMSKAFGNLKSAPAFTFAGTVRQKGQTMSIRLGFRKGNECTGTIGAGSKGGFAVISIGAASWVKPDEAMWKSIVAGAGSGDQLGYDMLKGKYFKVPASGGSGASSMTGFCDMDQMTSQTVPDTVTRGSITTVDGQRVVALTGTGKDKGANMYVTDTASPRIIEVAGQDSGANGRITITYGVPKSITAPPPGQVTDFSKMGL